MNFRPSLIALAAVVCLAVSAVAGNSPVRLIVDENLEPTSTFELRFPDAMVPPDKVGTTAELAPIVFHPALKGNFVWLSQRSGSFRPGEPLLLGTTYTVTLASGLKKADGRALSASLHETIKTPPLSIKGWNATNVFEVDDAPGRPRFGVIFNANVDVSAVAKFMRFVNRAGGSVPAAVEPTNATDRARDNSPTWRSNDQSLLTWSERFHVKGVDSKGDDSADSRGRGENFIWVTPQQPLPAGLWTLVIKRGLPANENHLRLLDTAEINVGTVRPFVVSAVEATNWLESGRRLQVTLSKPLATEATEANAAHWARLEPAPPNLKIKGSGNEILFTGDFALAANYRLIVGAGLPSSDPFALSKEYRSTVRFNPIPPRLYLEGFATHQLSTGSRHFHLLAINVPKIHLTARVFTAESAIHALEAYRLYTDPPNDETHPRKDDEPFEKLPLARLPAATWQRDVDGTSQVDVKREISLDWNEILGGKKSGVALLTAEEPNLPAGQKGRPGVQAIVQVTDLGAIWKTSTDETFVHIFSLASGQAVTDATIQALDEKGHPLLAEVRADAHGVARLKTSDATRWLVIASGADTHLVDFRRESESFSLWQLGIRNEGASDNNGRQALLFTERPLYKPGETVHLKGIVRDVRDGHAPVPSGDPATLRLVDPQGRRLVDHTIHLSDTGSLSEDFKLPASGLGDYHVELAMAGPGGALETVNTQDLEVQEYTPNAFEIIIPRPPTAVGETKIDLPVTAQYYMGKALSQAKMTWSIDAGDVGFTPAGFEAFDFCEAIDDFRLNEKLNRSGSFSAQGKVDLDSRGSAKVESTVPINTKAPQPRTTHLLCEITDLDEQTVSRSTEVTIQSSDFYLGIRREHGVVREGEQLPVDVVAVRTDGSPMPKPVEAAVRLTRIDWQTDHLETAGGGSEYRSQARFEIVSEMEIKTRHVRGSEGKWALVPDEKGATITVGKPGQYLLEAMSKDDAGHPILTATAFNVFGPGETVWDYRNPFQIELAADKAEYLAGQTARILVKTPISGEALVTVERDKVLRSFLTHLEGNAPIVEVPLQESDAPNVFVSVTLLRGAADSPKKYKAPEYRVGYCKLVIARPESKLTVYVKPEAPSYRPGDEVSVGAEVLDFNGHPVQNAEVTLYAVDEGVLSLMGYKTPDPFTFFNGERGLAVTTGLTLPTLLPEDPEQRSYGNKGYLVGGGGETGFGFRNDFATCAFWNASLRTGIDGRIAAKFIAPDALTRYRLMAVVQTTRDQFGSAESSFEVNKPVMFEPALPRFANIGDHLIVRGVLHNLTDADGEVDVHVEFDRTVSTPSENRHVNLPAHGSIAVDIPVAFVQPGKAVWKWVAKFSGGGATSHDAVESTMRVGYPVPLKREMRLTELHGGQADLLAGMNPELLEGTGAIKVSLTNSRAIELREPLDDLLHYPYGCVEQTTSTMLPWISMRDFKKVLPSLQRSDEEITEVVRQGVDRLLSMQTGSGGLSYWPGEETPMFWASAYGGLGMAMARRAGFQVPDEAFDRLCRYLSQQLRSTGNDGVDPHYSGGGPTDRCLALYALAVAGRAEPAYHELLFKRRNTLGAENRALLALAVSESHGPPAMIAELLKPHPGTSSPGDDLFWSRSRDTAVRLLACCRLQPNSPDVEKLVAELEEDRLAGHWGTTQGDSWSLLALGEYFRHAEKRDVNIHGTLAWNGRAEPIAVNSQAPLKVMDFAFVKNAAAGKTMALANPDHKKVFAEVLIESRPNIIAQPRQDQGYSIRRRYAKVDDDGTLHPLANPHIGDRVLVTLDIIASKAANYVAVNDPLPAVFEAINPVFKSQETLAGERLGEEWAGNHQELRDDRAVFFADHLEAGAYTIRYLARVRAAGTATAPSAKVEEMYHPERFGLTETMQVTSLPLK